MGDGPARLKMLKNSTVIYDMRKDSISQIWMVIMVKIFLLQSGLRCPGSHGVSDDDELPPVQFDSSWGLLIPLIS